MASTTDTLTAVLAFDGRHLTDDQVQAIGASPCMNQLRGRIAPKLLSSLVPGALRAIGEAIATALDIRLADVLIGGWNKYRELAKYADRDRYPPDDVNLVALGEHEIKSSHEPRIAVLVDGATVGEIRLRVDLEADIESATLKVQDARIREVSTGRCTIKGTLSCEGLKLAETERTVAIPGVVSFGSGIPIAARRDRPIAQDSNPLLADASG